MAEQARQYMISSPEDCPSITTSVATRIETGTLKFADFIASVQEYAVDDDLTVRAKSIGYIAGVLALFKPETLPRIEISVLVAFLRTRIDDNAGVKEASQGLRSLIGMTRFMKKDVVDISETIFKNTADLQRQPASARFAVYQLIEKSLERCRDVLEGMGERFIGGLLSLVEFEKDPRNLMVVFSFLHVVMAEFAVKESQTVALWDAVFRYYPISYNPKPEDKIQITKQDLQRRLEACITSNSRFAPYAFPALLAKLDQEIGATVKIETLITTSACIMAFSATAIAPYMVQCWSLIKYEAWSQMDPRSAMEGARLLKNLVTKVFEEGNDEQRNDLVRHATKDILDNMETPTEESSRKASLIVSAVAGGNSTAFSLVLKAVMPTLLTIYQGVDGKISETAAILKLFNRILDVANPNKSSMFYTASGDGSRSQQLECTETLGKFREEILGLYDAALNHQETSVQNTALQGLIKVAKVPCLLSYDEMGMIVQSLTTIVLARGDEDELRTEAIKGLQLLSSIPEGDVRNDLVNEQSATTGDTARDGAGLIDYIVFPALLAAMPTNTMVSDDQYQKIAEVYEALAGISTEVKVFDTFLKVMKTQLDQALNVSTYQMTLVILGAILSGLRQHILRLKQLSGSLRFPLNDSTIKYDEFVKELFTLVVALDKNSCSLTIRQYPNVRVDNKLLTLVGQIAMLIFRSVRSAQEYAAAEIFTLFVADEESKDKLQGWHNTDNSSSEQRQTVILTKYLLASLRPAPGLLMAYDLPRLAVNTIQAVQNHSAADSRIVGNSYSQVLAILVNKFGVNSVPVDDNYEQIDKVISQMLAICFSEKAPLDTRRTRPVITLAFQYASAMVKKGDDRIYNREDRVALLNRLILLLDRTGGDLIARGFGTLLAKSPILTKKNHAIVTPNHKAKLYDHFFPKLVERFESLRGNPRAQENCLVALTGIISHISGEKFLLQQSPVTILLRALDLNAYQPRPKRAALDLMISTAEHHPDSLIPHYNSVINRLIACMTDPDPRVRAMAVACTRSLPETSRTQQQASLPYKGQVMRALDVVVGDADGRVRTEAVDCKMVWFQIEEPDE